jgi:transaldolase
MKLFLDTADSNAIERLISTGIIDGITTNPTHLSKENQNPTQQILKICALLPDKDVSVEVTEKSADDVYKQAKRIAALSGNVVVKIPCSSDYYPVIKKLVDENIKINVTLVFTLVQGLMMSKLGVRYISPFIGRWDDSDVDGQELLWHMRHMIDFYGYSTEILAASLRHVRHVHAAIEAGSDIATVPVDLFEKMMKHPLTENGIAQFDRDWEKMNVKIFP